MKNNIVSVLLWGKEICKLRWEGGYRPKYGKVGSQVSINPEYHTFGFDVDPVGFYSLSTFLVQKGMSDICRANEHEGIPRFLSCSLPDDWGNEVFSYWIEKTGPVAMTSHLSTNWLSSDGVAWEPLNLYRSCTIQNQTRTLRWKICTDWQKK